MSIYDPIGEALGITLGECQEIYEMKLLTCPTNWNKIPWNKGKKYTALKPYTKEHCENISKAKKGKPLPNMRGGLHPRAKSIICHDTGEIFNSSAEAADKYNLSRQNLSAVLRGKQKTISGMRFSFYNK